MLTTADKIEKMKSVIPVDDRRPRDPHRKHYEFSMGELLDIIYALHLKIDHITRVVNHED